MKRKIPKKPRIRIPVPKPQRPLSLKKGKKGYDRKKYKKNLYGILVEREKVEEERET